MKEERQFLQEPHGVTSQKTAFFNVDNVQNFDNCVTLIKIISELSALFSI
jgi:hypothetical protein